MGKRLTKHDEGLALVLDARVLDALGIDQGTDLEIIVVDDALIVKPKHKKSEDSKKRETRLKSAADRIMDKYETVLKKLSKT